MSTRSRRLKAFRRNPSMAIIKDFMRDTRFQRYLKRRAQRYTDHPGIRMLNDRDKLREWDGNL